MAERTVDLVLRARDNASAAFQTLNGALNELTGVQEKVARGADMMKAAVSGSEADLRKLTQALQSGDVSTATQAFNQIAQVVDRMGAKLREQAGDVNVNRQAYVALAAQLEAARQALARMNETIGPRSQSDVARIKATEAAIRDLTKESRSAEAALQRSQTQLEDTTQNYNRLAAAAGVAEGAVRELGQAQERALGNSVFASQERLTRSMEENSRATIENARAARASEADYNRVAAAFRRPLGPLQQLVQALRGTGAASQQAAGGIRQVGQAAQQAAGGMQRFSASTTGARGALGAFYGDSRQALSLMQRLRGEVLALSATFVGFYGIFNQGSQAVEAFQALEAATNRLEAAVGGNVELAASELGRLRIEADRLGISFETLATNYSSFLISGQQAGLGLEEVQQIFTSVTEAGRVLGLNNERLGRIFTALTQIAGKGTVQMEELRQQLGDNLPGAVGILAGELGYAADELDQFYADVEAGAIGAEEGLIALARGLDNAFGDQLESSLDSVAAQVGRLQNSIFNSRLTAANSGFIDGLETLLAALNEFLNSPDGVRFFEALGAAAGNFLELLPGILDNIGLIGTAIQALVGLKLAQLIYGWAAGLVALGGGSAAARGAIVGLNVSLAATSPAMARAAASTGAAGLAFRGLVAGAAAAATAVRGLLAALGGPIGLALTALSFLAVGWLTDMTTEVDVTNRALTEHQRVMDAIRTAYTEAEEAGTDWLERLRNGVNDLSEVDIRSALADTQAAIDELEGSFNDIRLVSDPFVDLFDGGQSTFEVFGEQFRVPTEVFTDLQRLNQQFTSGQVTLEQYEAALVDLQRAANDQQFDQLARAALNTARDVTTLRGNSEDLTNALATMNGTASQTQQAMALGAAGINQIGATASSNIGPINAFAGAINALNGSIGQLLALIPSMQAGLQLASNLEQVEAAYTQAVADADTAVVAAGSLGPGSREAEAALAQATAARAEADRLRAQAITEITTGFDVNQAGGLGQFGGTNPLDVASTIQQTLGGQTDISGALRAGVREGLETLVPSLRDVIGESFDNLSPVQQGVLLGRAGTEGVDAFGSGGSLASITEAIQAGSAAGVAEAIRGASGGDRARGNVEAALFDSDISAASATQRAEELRRETEAAAEAAAEYRTEFSETVREQERAAELAGLSAVDREVALATDRAILEAREAGVELSAQDLENLEAAVRARVAAEEAASGGGGGGGGGGGESAEDQARERAQALEAEVERLQDRRAFLMEEIAYAQSQGDTARAETLQAELEGVNAELEAAIEAAIAFWEAMGGEGSAAAIQALRQTQAEINRLGATTVTTGEQMNDMIANKLTSAITRFAERVANGENAWVAFKEEFLRAIGEMLIEIGTLILRQALLNALTGGGGPNGGLGGGIAGLINGLFHTGGIAGRTPTMTRTINPAVFANAIRYHSGGVAGLRPNEVAAVLEEGEEVLTQNDPRHRFNGGGSGSGKSTIINAFDAPGFLDAALATGAGGDAILNYVRANRETVKAALEQ